MEEKIVKNMEDIGGFLSLICHWNRRTRETENERE